jgi:DNA-binding NtrC family response regulator
MNKNLRILVICRDINNEDILKTLLNDYDVFIKHSYVDAKKILDSTDIDIIIYDSDEDTSEWEFLNSIKSKEYFIIVFIDSKNSNNKYDLYKNGTSEVVYKPIKINQFHSIIKYANRYIINKKNLNVLELCTKNLIKKNETPIINFSPEMIFTNKISGKI